MRVGWREVKVVGWQATGENVSLRSIFSPCWLMGLGKAFGWRRSSLPRRRKRKQWHWGWRSLSGGFVPFGRVGARFAGSAFVCVAAVATTYVSSEGALACENGLGKKVSERIDAESSTGITLTPDKKTATRGPPFSPIGMGT
ncbi:hypothetical protein JCM17961_33580 [Endothiovibrio diazotrophicus]